MEIKVFLDSTEIAQILSEAWEERDHFISPEQKHERIRHLLRLKVKNRLEQALNDTAYSLLGTR